MAYSHRRLEKLAVIASPNWTRNRARQRAQQMLDRILVRDAVHEILRELGLVPPPSPPAPKAIPADQSQEPAGPRLGGTRRYPVRRKFEF